MKIRKVLALSVGMIVLSAGMVVKSQEVRAAQVDLSGVTQNWDKALPSASRFTVLPAFGNQAVRDNNTGLVWEKVPSATPLANLQATLHCADKVVGGTTGWRLPSVTELKSVQDPSLPEPFVPTDIFTGIYPDYWSATANTSQPNTSWIVGFGGGYTVTISERSSVNHVWCVRGPMNSSPY